MKRKAMRSLVFAGMTICGLVQILAAVSAGEEKPNVLLICIDDLRNVPGCYGGPAITPNIDSLAASGTVYTQHYVQFPVCGPSRSAMLSGQRPQTTRIYLNEKGSNPTHYVATDPVNRPTLPEYFRQNGYATASYGKVYHAKGASEGYGWSDEVWKPNAGWECYVDFTPSGDSSKGNWRPAYEIYEGKDRRHGDHQSTSRAIDAMARLKDEDRPFFIALGLYKPHLPFVAPKKYWDLYDEKDIKPINPIDRVEDTADWLYGSNEIETYGLAKGENIQLGKGLTHEEILTLTRAYLACASFADTQVGRILAKLRELGLEENTALVLWGDHGFHLGDYGHWAKNSQFDTSMASPLIVRLPGEKLKPRIAESVDIYPTLVEYCDLPSPSHLEGLSLLSAIPKEAAFSMCIRKHHCYSVRTAHFRYNEWRDYKDDFKLQHRELFEYRDGEPNLKNLVSGGDFHEVVSRHRELLVGAYRDCR